MVVSYGADAHDAAFPGESQVTGESAPRCLSPDNAMDPSTVAMVAMHDFDPSISLGCIRLCSGQIVLRHSADASGWSDVEAMGERGWVPSSFLTDLDAWNSHHAALGLPPSEATDKFVRLSTPALRKEVPGYDGTVPELYEPVVSSPVLEPSIRAARHLYESLLAGRPADEALQAFSTAIHSLLNDAQYLQRVTTRTAVAQRDALLVLLNELLAHVQTMERATGSSVAVAAAELNNVMRAATDLMDAATARRDSDRDSESNMVHSDGTVSHASSLLEDLSLDDTSSSVRNSAESSQSSRNADLVSSWEPDKPMEETLSLSPLDAHAAASAAFDQVASVTAAFMGQLHTFDNNYGLLFAFQRLVDLGRELVATMLCLKVIADCLTLHLQDPWVRPAMVKKHVAALAELDPALSHFSGLAALRAETHLTKLDRDGSKSKDQLVCVANAMLRGSARTMESVSLLLEFAPKVLLLQVRASATTVQGLRTLLVRRAMRCAPPERRPARSLSNDRGVPPPVSVDDVLKFAPNRSCTEPLDPQSADMHAGIPELPVDPCARPAKVLERDATVRGSSKAQDSELLRNARGDVQGGTLVALVRWLCDADHGAQSMPMRAFFLCFRTFTEAVSLAETLVSVYHAAGTDWRVQLHAVHFAFAWLKHYWLASDDSAALRTLCSFVQAPHDVRVQPSMDVLASLVRWRLRLGDGAQHVQLQVAYNEEPVVERVLLMPSGERLQLGLSGNEGPGVTFADAHHLYSVHNARAQNPLPHVSKSLLASLRTSPGPWNVSVLDFDPMELARQITIVESRLFAAILPNELLFRNRPYLQPGGQTSTSSAVHARAMTAFTTQLTNWMGECILRVTELRRRTLYLKFFVRLGSASLALHNYNLLMAVQGALNSSTILRLKRTWAGLSPKAIGEFEEQCAVMEHTRNFAAYRARLRAGHGPVLPFLGLVFTDLTFCMNGNPKMRPHAHGEVINFVRCTKLAHILGEVQRFQAVPYELVEVPAIQSFLADLRRDVHLADGSESYAVAAEQLYQRSLLLEPRESGAPSHTHTRSRSLALLPWTGSRRNSQERTSNESVSSFKGTTDPKLSRLERVMKRW